jgi:hypothetical protein
VENGVEYSEALVKFLERSITSSFNPQYLQLTRKRDNSWDDFYVEITDSAAIAHRDDGSPQRVFQIRTSDYSPTSFYLGFVALFRLTSSTHKHSLQHASLSIFHDIGDIVPLFRAEWDELAALSETSKHAQPHWHFVQSPERIERIVRSFLRPANEATEFSPSVQESEIFSGLADCGKFHFAMTSLGDGQFRHVFDSEEFQRWFAALTGYVGDQIAYLMKKTPYEGLDAVLEFAPS